MAIELSRETRGRIVASVRRYFEEEVGESIEDLKAGLLLDFFLAELGPPVYNQAVADAQAYFFGKVEDLEGSCHEPEVGYWR